MNHAAPCHRVLRYLHLPALAAALAATALGGCGRERGEGGGLPDGGAASRLPPAQRAERLSITIIEPTPTTQLTTTTSAITLDGVAFGDPMEIRWEGPSGEGKAEGLETWTVKDINLLPGDNLITIKAVASDGTTASRDITVKRNEFLGVSGQPQLSPAAAFVGQQTDVIVSVGLDMGAADLDPASVKLVQSDASGGWAHVVSMADDGDFAVSGDEIPDDGVYAGRFSITKSSASDLVMAVTASNKSGMATELAAMGAVPFVSQLSAGDREGAASMVSDMQHAFDDNVASGLSVAYGKATEVAAQSPHVQSYGISSSGSGVWATTTAGIITGTLAAHPDERGGVEVGNYAVFTGGARNAAFAPTDEAVDNGDALKARVCPAYQHEKVFLDDEVTIDRLKTLTSYGIVFLTTHGTSYDDPHPSLHLPPLPVHEMLLTSDKVTPESLAKYELELRTGQLAIGPEVAGARRFFITARFIDALPGRFQNSLVYVGACRSFWNGELAAAFLRKGAGAYFGYSDMVKNSFAHATGKALLQCLLNEKSGDGTPKSTAECFQAGLHDEGSGVEPRGVEWPAAAATAKKPPAPLAVARRPAYFKLLSRLPLSIASTPGLRNGGFEEVQSWNAASMQPLGWQRKGDARVMSKVGGYTPREGTRVGLISTGLGFTQSSGEVSQNFCVPAGATKLSYDWNFISSEFKSFCKNPKYQDNLKVTLEERGEGGKVTVLQAVKIDDLCDTVVDSTFRVPDVGYKDNDMKSWATGWQHFGPFDITGWAGAQKSIALRFSLLDLGDSLYDTVVLLDGIKIE